MTKGENVRSPGWMSCWSGLGIIDSLFLVVLIELAGVLVRAVIVLSEVVEGGAGDLARFLSRGAADFPKA